MTISIRLRGTPELEAALSRLGGHRRDAVQAQALEEAARYVETAVKDLMAEEKSGRWYGDHHASAPGEAPAVDLGNLISSIQVIEVTSSRATVGTSVDYAEHLEFGTSQMAPRPFFRPVVLDHQDQLVAIYRERLQAFIRGNV